MISIVICRIRLNFPQHLLTQETCPYLSRLQVHCRCNLFTSCDAFLVRRLAKKEFASEFAMDLTTGKGRRCLFKCEPGTSSSRLDRLSSRHPWGLCSGFRLCPTSSRLPMMVMRRFVWLERAVISEDSVQNDKGC